MPKKGGLGRGLNALFDENSTEEQSVVELKINEIEPNREQPRKDFDEKALSELCDSISQFGVLQPLLVRPVSSGGYQLVAGERRWRAARMAGLEKVPVLIRELSDSETMELALVENLQREDLNPIEEAEGFKTLINEFKLTQEEVASKVGRSRPAVANALRLLTLPEGIVDKVKQGRISAGHARAILSIEDDMLKEQAVNLAEAGASVREIEKLALLKKNRKKVKKPLDTFLSEVQLSLSGALGRKVSIKKGKNEKGILEIEFFSKEDLQSLANEIGGK